MWWMPLTNKNNNKIICLQFHNLVIIAKFVTSQFLFRQLLTYLFKYIYVLITYILHHNYTYVKVYLLVDKYVGMFTWSCVVDPSCVFTCMVFYVRLHMCAWMNSTNANKKIASWRRDSVWAVDTPTSTISIQFVCLCIRCWAHLLPYSSPSHCHQPTTLAAGVGHLVGPCIIRLVHM